MFLNDINKTPGDKFEQINKYLLENYGFVLSTNLDIDSIDSASFTIHDEILQLKMQGEIASNSTEISKRLVVLEGLKTFRESILDGNSTERYSNIIRDLVDYVVDAVLVESPDSSDKTFSAAFEDAIKNAMREFRSSRYLFPDSQVENDIRVNAMSILNELHNDNDIDESAWDHIGRRSSATGGHVPDSDSANIKKMGGDLELSLEPLEKTVVDSTGRRIVDPFSQHKNNIRGNGIMHEDEFDDNNINGNEEPLVRNPKSGRVERNPFATQHRETRTRGVTHPTSNKPKLAPGKVRNPRTGEEVPDPFVMNKNKLRTSGVVHEENTMEGKLRQLLETEVVQAEVMMAAKSFAQDLQEMVEKVGRLQNEDLPPVTDQMRQTYGTDSASAFQTQIYASLQHVMDALYDSKSQIDAAVESLASTGHVNAQVDMDVDLDSPDQDLMLDIEGEQDDTIDNFGSEEPLSRMKKESVDLRKKVEEMKKILHKAKKIKEQTQK